MATESFKKENTLISIIINNYNYADFIKEAIDSSLNQSYKNIEVIVVDDGSHDNSVDIIESYSDRITPVLKNNGGQASAMNAGIRVSRGDLILFLDADDYLFPHAVTTIVSSWQPGIAQVQSRLNLVDAKGKYIDLCPPPEVKFDSGDVRPLLGRKGRYNTTVTTGTCFIRSVIDEIFPIPEKDFRISADGYLVTVAPFYGNVLSIETSIGARRKHGNNLWAMSELNLKPEKFRKSFEHDFLRYKYLRKTADERGFSFISKFEMNDYLHVQDRLISIVLDSQTHPVSGDSKILLSLRGFWAIWRYSSFSQARKFILSLWFLWVGIAPRPWAINAIEWKFIGKTRPKWADNVLKKIRFLTC